MNTFQFAGKQKNFLIGLMALGVLCLTLTWFNDDELHTRFWSNILLNSVFFTGIAFIAVFGISAFTMTYSGWYTVFKRVWEAYGLFLIVGLGLMAIIILGIWLHWHHLYHWANAEAVAGDEVLSGKKGFLNLVWYGGGTFLIGGVWYLFARKFRSLSLDEDANGTNKFRHHRKLRNFASMFLPIGGFTSAAILWLWVMSVDAHWYSTMFAWYATASLFVSMLSLTVLILVYLKSKGYYKQVTTEHLHDLGKYIFAFSIFWTYLWFSQFMLIWYGNNGEETIYFFERRENYFVMFWANLIINFLMPFLVLMRNDTKRKTGSLVFAASIVFFGHWLDFFLMIKPGVRITALEHIAEHHEGHAAVDPHASPALMQDAEEHADAITSIDKAHGSANNATISDDTSMHVADLTDAAVLAPKDEQAEEKNDASVASEKDGLPKIDQAEKVDPLPTTVGKEDEAKAQGTQVVSAEHVEEHHSESKKPFASGYTIPGLLELGTFAGFLGLFLYFVFSQLRKAPLVPKKDPYVVESLHHHV